MKTRTGARKSAAQRRRTRGEPRTDRLTVRLSAYELAALKKLADERGLSLAACAVALVEDEAKRLGVWLPAADRARPVATCTAPDRHEPRLVCGYPMPCPHHSLVVVVGCSHRWRVVTNGKPRVLQCSACGLVREETPKKGTSR